MAEDAFTEKDGSPESENASSRGLAERALLLEHFRNTVTDPRNEHGAKFELSKCRCNCWFCPGCCMLMGYNLRARLIPILETFTGIIMVTLTIDPQLFPDPKTAYLYAMRKRCISVTTQDLSRWGYLLTRRYFYVVEWQKITEYAHFHVLYDSKFIDWNALLRSWSKHRPKDAGQVIGKRPPFGTVLFSAPKFKDAYHAACYATKYLIKYPEELFPAWVLEMGKERRIRRYSTSRGFWNTEPKTRKEPEKKRTVEKQTYADKVLSCGDSVNVFEIESKTDLETGEISPSRVWVGQVSIRSEKVLPNLYDPGNPERNRRSLMAENLGQVETIIEAASGEKPEWKRKRHSKISMN